MHIQSKTPLIHIIVGIVLEVRDEFLPLQVRVLVIENINRKQKDIEKESDGRAIKNTGMRGNIENTGMRGNIENTGMRGNIENTGMRGNIENTGMRGNTENTGMRGNIE